MEPEAAEAAEELLSRRHFKPVEPEGHVLPTQQGKEWAEERLLEPAEPRVRQRALLVFAAVAAAAELRLREQLPEEPEVSADFRVEVVAEQVPQLRVPGDSAERARAVE
jgi:hypothetical protein